MCLWNRERTDPDEHRPLWTDRRPIGILWLVERQFVSDDNPHGIAPDWRTRIRNAVKNAKDTFQGVYVHGGFTAKFLTTQPEWQNPLPLPDVWVDRIEGIAKLFADAGLRWGTTIKPFRPVGITDFVNGRIKYHGEVKIPIAEVEARLSEQINWCRYRGMTLFYLDSPRRELDYSWFNKKFPDCLLMPEITSGMGRTDPLEQDKFKWGLPYSRWQITQAMAAEGKNVCFNCSRTTGDVKARVRNAIKFGDIVMFRCWYNSAGMRAYREVVGGTS